MKNKAIIFLTFLTIILLAVVFVNSYAEAVFKKDNSQEKRRIQECQQNCNRNVIINFLKIIKIITIEEIAMNKKLI